ncbi:MAG: phosphoglucosamine mutase, partial [Acidimicrobiales bacterium]
MTLRFGTDGVRGVAGTELTPELVLALGRVAARALPARGAERTFFVGRDTRRSGPMLQAALSAGLAAEGRDVTDVGVLPTPGVAALSAEYGVPAAVISASHNPFADNGVKLFAAGGHKLDDVTEARVEEELAALVGAG